MVPPIYQTSLFTFANYADMADTFAGKRRQPIYSRGDNPTVMEFEARVAALEGAEAARGFSSGMAAISATLLAFVGAGERIVAVRNCYGDAYRLFERLFPRLTSRSTMSTAPIPMRSRRPSRRQAALSGKPDLDDVRDCRISRI